MKGEVLFLYVCFWSTGQIEDDGRNQTDNAAHKGQQYGKSF